ADQDFVAIGIGDDGRRGACAFRVFDDLDLVTIHDGHAGVGGAEVDADDLCHEVSLRIYKSVCRNRHSSPSRRAISAITAVSSLSPILAHPLRIQAPPAAPR